MMKDDERLSRMGKHTKAIHGGGLEKKVYGEISVPIFQTSTFGFPSAAEGAARFAGESDGYIYTRLNNPTANALEEAMALLEGGFAAIASSTGMAAVTTTMLTFLSQGDHVVATDSIYGASRMALQFEFARFGVGATFVDSSSTANIERAISRNTKVIFLETPTNPTMAVSDIRAAAELARARGAILVVDNTFAGPYLQRPLELGADIVVESLTKFINGHSDVLGGMVVTRNEELHAQIKRMFTLFGGTIDPHQAWLILRGLKTLPLRVERAQDNAGRLARFLSGHPKVTWLRYPGLPDHPQHEVARRQMDGFGSMMSFGVKNGLEGGITLMNAVRLITLAVSLGGIDSLIEHPASMTHAAIPREERERAGIRDELVRLSVGCEDFEDLRADLEHALSCIP
ncbi:MAG TPA: PLP-dependent aspartate aminotransferase family protein [Syntrophobacter fumaroxidans]|nr:PLP-dependent aspartate aminotransferase family protein [Syntrophobacter fumaroxidans]